MNDDIKYYGIYRGIVLNNDDGGLDDAETPKSFGRCKVFFDGIYPERFRESLGYMLPWAEPVFPIYGGNAYNEGQKQIDALLTPRVVKNWTNSYTGWCSVPHIGAYVWGFFQDGNINYPKFFGMSQVGNGFRPEHKNQHTFVSDNVKIIIDENPLSIMSTNKFDSNNASCSTTATYTDSLQKSEMPTTLDITIVAMKPDDLNSGDNIGETEETLDSKYADDSSFCAINLTIVGNVNSKIVGNVYEEHTGDKFITHYGNKYVKQVGDVEIEHYGNTVETHYGNQTLAISKNTGITTETTGNIIKVVDGDVNVVIKGNKDLTVGGNKSSFTCKADYREAQSQIADVCANIIKHN